MLTLNDVRRIPFPNPNDLEWLDWPWPRLPEYCYSEENLTYIIAEDMVQLSALLKKGNVEYLVCNENYEIGFLQIVLFTIFQGDTWNEIADCIGLSDSFWYTCSIESGSTRIKELPEWCQKVMLALLDSSLVECVSASESEYYYFIEDYSNVLNRDLKQVYLRLKDIFIEAASAHHNENGELDELDSANRTFAFTIDKLIGG